MITQSNKDWIWIAFYAERQQAIDLHFGNRDYEGASVLWDKMPVNWQKTAVLILMIGRLAKWVIPEEQHYVKKILTQTLELF